MAGRGEAKHGFYKSKGIKVISQGPATAIDEIQARLQADIGEFLGAKKKLLEMMSSPLLTISDRAKDLYATQSSLENDLTTVTDLIKQIKTDAYTTSDVLKAGTFLALMESHLSDVRSLQGEYDASVGKVSSSQNIYLYAAAAGVGLWLLMKRGKK